MSYLPLKCVHFSCAWFAVILLFLHFSFSSPPFLPFAALITTVPWLGPGTQVQGWLKDSVLRLSVKVWEIDAVRLMCLFSLARDKPCSDWRLNETVPWYWTALLYQSALWNLCLGYPCSHFSHCCEILMRNRVLGMSLWMTERVQCVHFYRWINCLSFPHCHCIGISKFLSKNWSLYV